MELYSRSEAAAMLGITVRKLDELRARRLIGYLLQLFNPPSALTLL